MNHDDNWLFMVLYIGLAVVLSIAIGLFWLVVVVAVHFALEWIRQWFIRPGFWSVLSRVLWELKLDISLILFALALSLYLELTMGVVGLNAAARGGAMGASRFLVLQRVLRGILLSLDDVAQVVRAVLRARRRKPKETDEIVEEHESGWRGRWTTGDYISLGLGAICIGLILLAPFLDDYTFESVLMKLGDELQPFPAPEVD